MYLLCKDRKGICDPQRGGGCVIEEQFIAQMRKDESEWCLALHGNHDEHQCYKKPGHSNGHDGMRERHECYCGVWW